MSREPVTFDSMVEHIDGFGDFADRVDAMAREVAQLRAAVTKNAQRMKRELSTVDRELEAHHNSLTQMFETIAALREHGVKDPTAREHIKDLYDASAQSAETLVELRNKIHADRKHMWDEQASVDKMLASGDGVVMIFDGLAQVISFRELAAFLGLGGAGS